MPELKELVGEVSTTVRGFQIIEFRDHYGAPCSLQQSSLAEYEQPGSSAIWLGCDKNAEPHHVTGEVLAPRMHLTRAQVRELVELLINWLNTGYFDQEG